MEHLDAELLSLMALGEPLGTDADADHLATCAQCSETLRGLQHAVHIATLDPAGIQLEEPGHQNWTAIHQALGLSADLATDPLTRPTAVPPVSSGTPATSPAAEEAPPPQDKETHSAPTPLRSRAKNRHARPGLWIAAAAAGIALGTAAGWTAAGVLEHTGPPAPAPSGPASTVLAQTPLAPLPTHTGSGEAQVQQLPDGTRQLTIQLSNDHISGFRGVWVGSADLTKMVSLGVLANDTGTFTIPAGIDLAQYPIVDISDQPYNGNPAHSADSIARGTLNPKT